jgi:hypothetical protein
VIGDDATGANEKTRGDEQGDEAGRGDSVEAPMVALPAPMMVAIALYDWSSGLGESSGGEEQQYLSFAAGDQIEVTEEGEENGWWAGTLNGRVGWFPVGFCSIRYLVEPLEEPQASTIFGESEGVGSSSSERYAI